MSQLRRWCWAGCLLSGLGCERSVAGAPNEVAQAYIAPALAVDPPIRAAVAPRAPFRAHPDAVVDLTSASGMRLLNAQWRYHDTQIIPISARGPGADLKPSGAPIASYDYTPKAGPAEFDDSSWPVIEPASLETRRSTGKLCFAWYRTSITLPERVGTVATSGSTAVLEVVVDDYAELWVNGQLTRELGDTAGGVVSGFNTPNHVIVARNLRPGQKVQLAVFAINGPISQTPDNFIWIRSATLDFYRDPPTSDRRDGLGRIRRLDPALDQVVAADARIEKLASGFEFTEGPVWSAELGLLFSDPNGNTIYRRDHDGLLSVFRAKSGYRGLDIAEYTQPGSNGLAFDREHRLTINEHGNRRITRLERNGSLTVLADRFEGKRLNSPNDLVYRSDDSLYFTDPPFGLPKTFQDPHRELPFSGIYRVANGRVELLSKELEGPNGLAFSPDEKVLYVDNWDVKKKVVMRYDVLADGSIGAGRVFFDATRAPGEEALDGLKVDARGNLYVSGPGGVFVLSPAGKHLGTVEVAELPANFAFGDADGRSLYMTARSGIYRVRVNIPGSGFDRPTAH